MADAQHVANENRLKHILEEMAREKQAKKDAEARIKELEAAGIDTLREIGSVVFTDPITHKPLVANVRQAESIEVDAGKLLAALIEQTGDEEEAGVIWDDVLKPPVVDTAAEGKFLQATVPTNPDDPHSARIWPETVAKVATFKTAKAFIGWSKPGG